MDRVLRASPFSSAGGCPEHACPGATAERGEGRFWSFGQRSALPPRVIERSSDAAHFVSSAQKGRITPDALEPCITVVDQLAALPTPALLLDERRMLANIARLRERAMGLGVKRRAHLKTTKSVDVARRLPARGLSPRTAPRLTAASGHHGTAEAHLAGCWRASIAIQRHRRARWRRCEFRATVECGRRLSRLRDPHRLRRGYPSKRKIGKSAGKLSMRSSR